MSGKNNLIFWYIGSSYEVHLALEAEIVICLLKISWLVTDSVHGEETEPCR
jgi:hypothetical protein